MSSSINILSTKKLSTSQADYLSKIGLLQHIDTIQTSSVFDFIEPIHPNIIFSSFKGCQYGLTALGESAKKYNYFCVGQKSKTLLEQNHLHVEFCANYSKDLTDKILITNSYTYITGSKRLNTIPSFLTKNNINFEEIIAYKSEANEKIPKGKQDIILWFSPGGIKAYYNQNKLDAETKHYCIGTTTQKALQTQQPTIQKSHIHSLLKPSTDDLIELVCSNTIIK
jgi:uroporphyrinogen-III synthase